MKKIFYLILLIAGPVLFLIITIFLYFSTKSTNKTLVILPTPTPYNSTFQNFPGKKPSSTPIPTFPPTIYKEATHSAENGRVEIYGVSVENFFVSPAQTNDQGDVLIVDDPDYHIAYLNQFNSFKITILGSPFEEARQKAEQQFLDTLGISQQDACKLPLTLGTPRFANPDEAGTNYPLSFCQ